MFYVILVLGFILVIKGAGFLVDGSSALAKRLRVSNLVIGLTIVAFGTSLPELFVNIFASIQGNSEIAIGNILGSNTANILLILGLSAVIYPLQVGKGTVWKEIPFSLLAVLVLAVMINDRLINREQFSLLTRSDGYILITFFIIFLYYSVSIAKGSEHLQECVLERDMVFSKSVAWIFLGLILLIAGGKLIVDGAVFVAGKFGLSESMIGLTIVAVGTSVPELATSVIAAIKKNPEIAVGNVVGSNIFNIFFILGISSIIKPLPIVAKTNIDISIVLIATIILFICMFTGKKLFLDRWEGGLLLIFYIGYVTFLVIQG
ncbi:MAG: calcium/sodium antiporter [Sedimentisphaerales bacterium]|nr:calcium/sodium antiporter [Sedimentisphaerales bacterium]